MKRTTKYVAFDVHQATTEGGQAHNSTPGLVNGSASAPRRNAMRHDAHRCTSKLMSSGPLERAPDS